MSRFDKLFERGKKALGVYLTAGFPRPGEDIALCRAALAGGADFLELGFPFSDPIADGPVIQRAATAALSQGASLRSTLDLAASLRKETEAPLVLMGYANPVHHMGYPQFARELADAGADAAIIPDLPWEEAQPLRKEMSLRSLAFIPMASPTTSPERLAMLVREGSGFLYLVSMTGLTGDAFAAKAPWVEVAEEARKLGTLPVCVGFGIRTGADARAAIWGEGADLSAEASAKAEGVIVGTAVIEAAEGGGPEAVEALVRELKGALE